MFSCKCNFSAHRIKLNTNFNFFIIMSEFNEELYLEMVENEQEELACYDDEVNVFDCVFNSIVESYE